MTVDRVTEWKAPGLEVEMLAEGMWLDSPTDMAKAWPKVWATAEAARRWQSENNRGNALRESIPKEIPPLVRTNGVDPDRPGRQLGMTRL